MPKPLFCSRCGTRVVGKYCSVCGARTSPPTSLEIAKHYTKKVGRGIDVLGANFVKNALTLPPPAKGKKERNPFTDY